MCFLFEWTFSSFKTNKKIKICSICFIVIYFKIFHFGTNLSWITAGFVHFLFICFYFVFSVPAVLTDRQTYLLCKEGGITLVTQISFSHWVPIQVRAVTPLVVDYQVRFVGRAVRAMLTIQYLWNRKFKCLQYIVCILWRKNYYFQNHGGHEPYLQPCTKIKRKGILLKIREKNMLSLFIHVNSDLLDTWPYKLTQVADV